MKTLLIIPAFNEDKYITQTIRAVKVRNPNLSILVINDGSLDKTEEEVQKTGVLIISHVFNLGYGATLQTGYKYALRQGYDYIVQMDADGQHEAKFIKDLLKPLINNQADLVVGSRFLKYSYKMPRLKRMGAIFFSNIIKLITGKKISDPTSGYRAFKRSLLKVLVTQVYPTDFPDADLLITLLLGGVRIEEIPVKMYPSPKEKKPMHNGVAGLYYIFKVPLSILIGLIRSRKLTETQS